MLQNGKIEIGAERAKKLKAIVKKRGKKWSVVVAQVDPDGIATSFAVQAALEHLGAECKIYYSGGFGHPQNRILDIAFELKTKHMRQMKDLPDDTVLALADSSRLADSRFRDAQGRKMTLAPERFGLVVDHHLEDVEETDDLLPIIITCGAAATLGWKLVCAVGAKADERLCQLTAIGIQSDTDRLTHPITKAADREVFNKAMESVPQQFIHDCFDYELPERYLELYDEALSTRTNIGPTRIAHVTSLLMEDEGDYLSLMADSFRKVKGAETTVVWGVAGKEVRASVRTRSKQEGLNDLIDAVFGAGNGGSKYGSGGARYTLADPHVPFAHTGDLLIQYLSAQYRERLALFLGESEKKRSAKTDKTVP